MRIRFGTRTLLISIALLAIIFSLGYRIYQEQNTLLIQIAHKKIANNRLQISLNSTKLRNVKLLVKLPQELFGEHCMKTFQVSANDTYEISCDPGLVRIEYSTPNANAHSQKIIEFPIPVGYTFHEFHGNIRDQEIFGKSNASSFLDFVIIYDTRSAPRESMPHLEHLHTWVEFSCGVD